MLRGSVLLKCLQEEVLVSLYDKPRLPIDFLIGEVKKETVRWKIRVEITREYWKRPIGM